MQIMDPSGAPSRLWSPEQYYPGIGVAPIKRAPPGYALVWEPDGLGGLGKFKLKKLVKGVGGALKKIAPIAAAFIPGVGPLVAPLVASFTAGRAKQAAAAPDVQAAIQAAEAATIISPMPSGTGLTLPRSAQQMAPTYEPRGGAVYNGATEEQPRGRAATGGALPGWLIPVALGGGALLLVMMMRRK